MLTLSISDFVLMRRGIYGVLHTLVLLLSLLLVAVISFDTFRNENFLQEPSYQRLQFGVCLLFLCDYVLEFFLAPNKRRYFFTHLIFLFVSVPYLTLIDFFGWTLKPEILYFLRFIPLVRGAYALAMVVSWFTHSRLSSLFVTYIALLFSIVYFCSLIFFVLEYRLNPLVSDYGEALWWAAMTTTTVGSNIYAITPLGMIMSVILAALGMMFFPIFTVYVTARIQKSMAAEEARKKAANG